MKAFVTIELEISFTEEQTKELDGILKKERKTLAYHLSESLEDVLVNQADVPKEYIKSILVNRVD